VYFTTHECLQLSCLGEYTFLSVCRKSGSITWRVPSYPFVSVALNTGERIYVRLRSEEYFAQQVCGRNRLVDAKKSSCRKLQKHA